jgi:hypothetical protein
MSTQPECTEARFHGNPFRYCACGWKEAPDHTARTNDIENRFGYHPATEVTGPQHDATRAAFRTLAHMMTSTLPEGRHKALCLTELQSAMHWANTAIACDTKPATT